MLFNSLSFAIFFPLVAIIFFALPHRFRWAWLTAASCYFYMSFIPYYLLLLAVMIVTGYFTGRLMESSRPPRRKMWLALSLIINLGMLGFFKYFNFFNTNLDALADFLGWNYSIHSLSIALPLALSFVTFQGLSYSFEVYSGRFKAERHFGIYSIYILFFPKLLAGPIERPQALLPQFREKHDFDYDGVTSGLRLIAWGLFKKIVVAERLSAVVAIAYGHPENLQGPALLLAAVFYTFQIYYDFSGYTDIALGVARILGFRLTQNFNHPNFARSIGDFWRRWHISLSSWFRDYIYFPMGGSRRGYWRQCLNLMVVFLATGLWHGANWTFVLWGAYHGTLIILELSYKRLRTRFGSGGLQKEPGMTSLIFSIAVTFMLVCLGRIIFRAGTIQEAAYIFSHLGNGWAGLVSMTAVKDVLRPLASRADLFYCMLGILSIEAVQLVQVRFRHLAAVASWPPILRWGFYYVVLCLLLFGQTGDKAQFVYFRF